MSSTLFIPGKLKVGFKSHNYSSTKTISRLTYYTNTGSIRNEKKWQDWRDHEMGEMDVMNTPISGLVLNRGVGAREWQERYKLIRIWDPRGFEFNMRMRNLLYIMMHSGIEERELVGEYVYSWDGVDMILLPLSSPSYVPAIEYRQAQLGKVKASELMEGCYYESKTGERLIYLGKHRKWEVKKTSPNTKTLVASTRHIFQKQAGGYLYYSNLSHIANRVSNTPVDNYEELKGKLYEVDVLSKPVELILEPVNPPLKGIYYRDIGEKLGAYRFGSEYLHALTYSRERDWSRRVPTIQALGAVRLEGDKLSSWIETREVRQAFPGDMVGYSRLRVRLENGSSIEMDDWW